MTPTTTAATRQWLAEGDNLADVLEKTARFIREGRTDKSIRDALADTLAPLIDANA